MGSHRTFSSQLPAIHALGLINMKRSRDDVNGMALFLAWTGMVVSILLCFGALTTFLNPDEVLINENVSGTRLMAATLLLLNILFFRFNFLLRRSVKEEDWLGIMSTVKSGCYIMTTLEVTVSISLMVFPLFYLAISVVSLTNILVLAISQITLLFSLLLVYGVVRQQSGSVLIYLAYKDVLFFILIIIALAGYLTRPVSFQYVFGMLVINQYNYIIIFTFFYVFSTSFAVLQYDILLINKSENISAGGIRQTNIESIKHGDNIITHI